VACSKLGSCDAIFIAEFMVSNYQIHNSLQQVNTVCDALMILLHSGTSLRRYSSEFGRLT